MNRRKQNSFQSGPSYNQVTLLAQWLNVIADFHFLHAQLSNYLLAHAHSPISSPETMRRIGQCDIDQIKELLATMHSELEIMLSDANQLDHITSDEGYEQLTNHVTHVERLNQQAKTLLCLATLPIG